DTLDPAHEFTQDAGLGALQSALVRAPFEEAAELFVDGALDVRQASAGARGGFDAEVAGDLARVERGLDTRGDPIAVDEALVQARRLADRQDARHQVEQVGVFGIPLGYVPDLVQPRLRHAILRDLALRPGAARHP